MTLSIIPAVVLIMLMVLSHPKEATTQQQIDEEGADAQYETIERQAKNEELEYRTIFRFIKKKFKKIKEEDARSISRYLVEFGHENEVDPKLAAAVIARESAFNKKAVSKTGAKGLGQIKDFNFPTLNIQNPFSIKENVSGTTSYLKKMLKKWQPHMNKSEKEAKQIQENPKTQKEKIELALASYYKGFTAVKREGLDEKTKNYIDDIMSYYNELVKTKKEVAKK